jgi:Ca2+-binding EF-hand superfamily protein
MDAKEIRETFDYFDADGNGTIEKPEFMKLLEALGAEMEPDEAAIGFDMIDADNNQHIDFDEFIGWWQDR